jgi:hypothetical protein
MDGFPAQAKTDPHERLPHLDGFGPPANTHERHFARGLTG